MNAAQAGAALEHARWLADSGDVGWLTTCGAAARPGEAGGLVELGVDEGGAPLLFPRDLPAGAAADPGGGPDPAPGAGPACLVVPEPALGGLRPADVAQVVLVGRVEPAPPRVRLGRPRSAWQPAAGEAGSGAPTRRLEVATVHYRPRRGSGLAALTVSGAGWRVAWPGRCPAGLARLLAHLDRQHRPQLRQLWALLGGTRTATSVTVSDLRPQRLHLDGLTHEGATTVELPFRRPVSTPAELSAELLHQLCRTRWGHCERTVEARHGASGHRSPG